ncbi:MAG: ABC-type branched-chain amino acid transport system ATPase component [Aeromicrobium sp.]|jgi:branched-chain amino acid transport system ATP-binding protein|nr:ABC-type branched-chain amino acid transport system ATPase component [Aeromicrobium sp.]
MTDTSGTPLLVVDDVAVHFGGVKAVDGISFEIAEGSITGIIGPNGSGKSTLIAALTRFVPLTRGALTFDGVDLHRLRASDIARHGIARTFQTVRLLPDLTVEENVRLGADVSKDRRGAPERVASALEATGLTEVRRSYPGELSYGTQRRVEIARAVAMAPRLLLLDEPTAGMNQGERTEITGLMKQLSADGLTQLLVEHDVQMMLDACDHLVAMAAGRLITNGNPADVVRHPGVREAYLGRKWGADARA